MRRFLLALSIVLATTVGACVPPPYPECSMQYVTKTDILDVLENDRLLLAELRKNLPPDRDAGMAWWRTVKRLAVTSEPRLAPQVSKVGELLAGMYDLLEVVRDDDKDTETRYAAASRLQQVGDLYLAAIQEFADAVVLVVITHLDSVQYVVEEK